MPRHFNISVNDRLLPSNSRIGERMNSNASPGSDGEFKIS